MSDRLVAATKDDAADTGSAGTSDRITSSPFRDFRRRHSESVSQFRRVARREN